jgi:thioredoxin
MKGIIAFALSILVCAAFSLAGNSRKGGSDGEVIKMDKAMFLDKVFDYTKDTIAWQYRGDKPAVIDFYADWCSPCRMVAPIMQQLARDYKDRVVFYKVNVDQEKELASFFCVTSIPLFVFVPVNGEPQLMKGAADKETYERLISEYLLK